jgi:hypothetical protein
MRHIAKSIRPFIGAQDFEVSRSFYRDMGFQEHVISEDMSFFSADGIGFYLQQAYVKDWIENTCCSLRLTTWLAIRTSFWPWACKQHTVAFAQHLSGNPTGEGSTSFTTHQEFFGTSENFTSKFNRKPLTWNQPPHKGNKKMTWNE